MTYIVTLLYSITHRDVFDHRENIGFSKRNVLNGVV